MFGVAFPIPQTEESQDSDDESPQKRRRALSIEDYYKIASVKEKLIKKFQAYTYDYNINFKNLEDGTLTEV
jgi:hypothetical protein